MRLNVGILPVSPSRRKRTFSVRWTNGSRRSSSTCLDLALRTPAHLSCSVYPLRRSSFSSLPQVCWPTPKSLPCSIMRSLPNSLPLNQTSLPTDSVRSSSAYSLHLKPNVGHGLYRNSQHVLGDHCHSSTGVNQESVNRSRLCIRVLEMSVRQIGWKLWSLCYAVGLCRSRRSIGV